MLVLKVSKSSSFLFPSFMGMKRQVGSPFNSVNGDGLVSTDSSAFMAALKQIVGSKPLSRSRLREFTESMNMIKTMMRSANPTMTVEELVSQMSSEASSDIFTSLRAESGVLAKNIIDLNFPLASLVRDFEAKRLTDIPIGTFFSIADDESSASSVSRGASRSLALEMKTPANMVFSIENIGEAAMAKLAFILDIDHWMNLLSAFSAGFRSSVLYQTASKEANTTMEQLIAIKSFVELKSASYGCLGLALLQLIVKRFYNDSVASELSFKDARLYQKLESVEAIIRDLPPVGGWTLMLADLCLGCSSCIYDGSFSIVSNTENVVERIEAGIAKGLEIYYNSILSVQSGSVDGVSERSLIPSDSRSSTIHSAIPFDPAPTIVTNEFSHYSELWPDGLISYINSVKPMVFLPDSLLNPIKQRFSRMVITPAGSFPKNIYSISGSGDCLLNLSVLKKFMKGKKMNPKMYFSVGSMPVFDTSSASALKFLTSLLAENLNIKSGVLSEARHPWGMDMGIQTAFSRSLLELVKLPYDEIGLTNTITNPVPVAVFSIKEGKMSAAQTKKLASERLTILRDTSARVIPQEWTALNDILEDEFAFMSVLKDGYEQDRIYTIPVDNNLPSITVFEVLPTAVIISAGEIVYAVDL